MYCSKYKNKNEVNVNLLQNVVSVSLDEGLNSSLSDTQDGCCQYLEDVFGDELRNILTECAIIQPEDPISYVASLLERE